MKLNLLLALACILFSSACSAEATPTAPQPTVASPATAFVSRTEIPAVNTRTDRVAPTRAPTTQATNVSTETLPPTEALPPTETSAPTVTAVPTEAGVPTNIPATLAPTFSNTAAPNPNLAPGVYVTSLKITPPEPNNKPAEFFFTVSFLNTVGENVNYPRWRVLILPQGQTKAIGDPQGTSKTIVNGISTQNTEPWSIRVTSACESFVAQPVWENEDRKQTMLMQPDGSAITLTFQVCP